MSCLLLEGGLPETIDGVPIYADYRNMIRFEQILDDDGLTDVQKTMLGVSQLFDELPPGGIERAVDRLQWFYSRGKAASEEDGQQGGKKAVRAYDLTYDADASCIYAAFRQAYQIDLIEIPYLHWWAFLALLENLPDSTAMAQRMQLRAMDLKGIKDKKMQEHYAKLQKQVALPAKAAARPRKVESMAERLARRYLEAQAELERRRLHGV
ncbi:MAG: hypothetical protein DBX91_08420 [Subdoligranulum variabile]|nr:MAG: hypothetical protein DBX91_08420 [Subdoligranulum variabile]